MRKVFIFIFALTLFTGIASFSKVYAVDCSGGDAICAGKQVGETGCNSPFGGGGAPSACRPSNFSSRASDNKVSCTCDTSLTDAKKQQIIDWIAANSEDSDSGTGNPSGTGGLCIPTSGCDYEPDFACISKKILNPGTVCCENKCVGSTGETDPLGEKYRDFGIVGIRVRIDEESIPTLINILLTTVLGIIGLYALLRGIYVAGVKRTQAVEADALAQVNKELTAIVIGFVVAFSFIFLIQVVFNVLGLKPLNDFNVSFDGAADPNTPQLVISGDAD